MESKLEMGSLYYSLLHKKRNLCGLTLRKKYRSHFELIALMLEAAKDSDVTRFSILKRAGTNCKELTKYLQTLAEIGFVEMTIRKDQILYRASETGLDFLRQYYVLFGMLMNASSNKTIRTLYEPGPDTTNEGRHSATQIAARLQRNP